MTEKEYKKGLETLKNQASNHAFMPELDKGYSKINVVFLKKALATIQTVKKETPSVSVEKIEKKVSIDPILSALIVEQSDLFAKRGTLSNALHKYPYTPHYDAKRGEIMDRIKITQRKIAKVMQNIAHFRQYNRLPPEIEEFNVPIDAAECERKKVSLRGSISHKRRHLKGLLGNIEIDEAWDIDTIAVKLEDTALEVAQREDILRGYEKLNNLKKHLEYVEKAIKSQDLHAE